RELLSDPGRRRSLGERARSHCMEHFSLDKVVDNIINYYRLVIAHDCKNSGRPLEITSVDRSCSTMRMSLRINRGNSPDGAVIGFERLDLTRIAAGASDRSAPRRA